MTLEQKKNQLNAFEWSLIVGYDEAAKSYIVRHRNVEKEFALPFDGFGRCDPVNWFCVLVIGGMKKPIPLALEAEALKRAVSMAKGEIGRADEADASGVAALELWVKVLKDGHLAGAGNAAYLQRARGWAAQFLRDIAGDFVEETRKSLLQAAEHYDRVSAAAGKLQEAIKAGRREDAAAALESCLQAERQAIAGLEASLK
jgi:hypothetical protein